MLPYRPLIGIPLWVLTLGLDKYFMGDHMGWASIGVLAALCWWSGREATPTGTKERVK